MIALPPAGELIVARFLQGPTVPTTRALLGQYLCRTMSNGSVERWPICEVEAYDGPEDKACHAHRGKTPRNAVMFEPGGVWYIYLCYGVHELLNIVTGPKDFPAATLIRGAGGVYGPGRLTKALKINRDQNKRPSALTTGLWLESSGFTVPDDAVEATPRIGIDYAGREWAGKLNRFHLPPDRYYAIFGASPR